MPSTTSLLRPFPWYFSVDIPRTNRFYSPERGSFPLDHDGTRIQSCNKTIKKALADKLIAGECKHLIADYLKCLKSQRGVNDEECRRLAKGYLSCRMEKYVPQSIVFAPRSCVTSVDRAFSRIAGTSWPRTISRISAWTLTIISKVAAIQRPHLHR